jgi:NAD(P)-dependent dehydrogenase (short-subunit alcohol dehydrogenase family)
MIAMDLRRIKVAGKSVEAAVNLSGKVALVTGGARGLGVEIASEIAKLGAHVIVAARSRQGGEDAAAMLRSRGDQASALELDVTREKDRSAALASIARNHGRLDILVNNAAIFLDGPDAGSPVTREPSRALQTEVRETFEVNFFAPLFLTQTLLPLLMRSDAPRIVNVSSMRGSLTHMSDPASPVSAIRALGYDASKAALNASTVLISREFVGTPLKINAVHPGWLRTAMGGGQADMSAAAGAATVVRYATLDDDGPTGGFFFGNERLAW